MRGWGAGKTGWPVWTVVRQLLKKLPIKGAGDPATQLRGIDPRVGKTCPHTQNVTQMSTAVFFQKPHRHKRCKHPSTDERTRSIWCVHPIKYCSSLGPSGYGIHAGHSTGEV